KRNLVRAEQAREALVGMSRGDRIGMVGLVADNAVGKVAAAARASRFRPRRRDPRFPLHGCRRVRSYRPRFAPTVACLARLRQHQPGSAISIHVILRLDQITLRTRDLSTSGSTNRGRWSFSRERPTGGRKP